MCIFVVVVVVVTVTLQQVFCCVFGVGVWVCRAIVVSIKCIHRFYCHFYVLQVVNTFSTVVVFSRIKLIVCVGSEPRGGRCLLYKFVCDKQTEEEKDRRYREWVGGVCGYDVMKCNTHIAR